MISRSSYATVIEGEQGMLRSLLGVDWKKSKAHLLLLSKFIHPQKPDDFSNSDIWENALKEKPSQAIRRFQGEGLIEIAGLESTLDYKFKVFELKEI
jgi:hypothetical protein